ncbi:MAG: hypothetical protein IT440_13575 [Phycisphaeraceae bacterium]|nr:hypothetical protein [Phycisphaeraceae bacterium]
MSGDAQIKALQERVQALHQRIDEVVGAARRRKNTALILMLFVIVAMACYLTFAYRELSQYNASEAAMMLESQARTVLAEQTPELVKMLKEYAPEAADQAEAMLMGVPEMVDREARNLITRAMAEMLPNVEAELTKQMIASVDAIKTEVGDDAGKTDPAKVQKLLNDIAQQLAKNIETHIVVRLHEVYQHNAEDLLDYLNKLGEGKQLDDREKIHRELIIQFLALIEKYEEISKATGDISGVPDNVKQVVETLHDAASSVKEAAGSVTK